MRVHYELADAVNLHVPGRISKEDAFRQMETAGTILQRLKDQPGIILADEVGMGKTFVALAVAASVALREPERRPVVVMVPPSLKEKWPKDFRLFSERCLTAEASKRLTFASADRAVQFLKLLDDEPSERVSIIFLTHGAMSPQRKLKDGWVKLAIIQRSLYGRHKTQNLRRALSRYAGELLQMRWVDKRSKDVWQDLLKRHPERWLWVLKKHGIPPKDNDDPVPEAVLTAMKNMDLGRLYHTLRDIMPHRRTKHFQSHLAVARERINEKITKLWEICIRSLNFKLPLLIFDEAHHLKNPHTQLASLFHFKEAEEDAEEFSRGTMAGVFERMLFLTATPFQLGHHELCSVLERFAGIDWNSEKEPSIGRKAFIDRLEDIRTKLDAAQEAAVRLDHQWGQLRKDDLQTIDLPTECTEKWWQKVRAGGQLSPIEEQVLCRFQQTHQRMRGAEESIRPYLIRHSRPKSLCEPHAGILRRQQYAGRNILDEQSEEYAPGLEIEGDSMLPFLLASRIACLKPDARPVFAEGLASSYEAFLETRRRRISDEPRKKVEFLTDGDDDGVTSVDEDEIARWYLEQLQSSIKSKKAEVVQKHPKVAATVNRTVELWKDREKVLVFCHYLVTGDVLQRRIRQAVENEINKMAARRLRISARKAAAELERIGQRFFDQESPLRRGCDQAVELILKDYFPLKPQQERITSLVRRYLRTPSFLARYFPIDQQRMTEEMVLGALRRPDASGMTLEQLLRDFFEFLIEHCGEDEREQYLSALESVQPGELVRLANGNTRQETRQRLMLTFNTPFYPEILVASLVLAEGVDLHLNCRHVIHHDLCWNPSTLEQRTGRIDRIGAKVERCGKSILLYLPYIGQTQDEKMYRVVMDRERWFKVVMGEKYKVDVRTTEKLAERLPFPESAANELIFNLSVVGGPR